MHNSDRGPGEQRTDFRTAAIVQHGLSLQAVAGIEAARRYLRQQSIPAELMERVLSPGRRRIDMPGSRRPGR
jgi:hypothetical protein